MIPRITSGGCSFKGAFQYYLHDKGKTTRERVAWTHTENLLTENPDHAWKVMAYTAKDAERLKKASGQKMGGRKLTKPVFAYSLAWHPDQNPDQKEMLAAAHQSLAVLGFTELETVIIAHRDEPQKHVHIIVNRVHPMTGIAADTGNSKLKLSDFAREHERDHGKVYCPQREENHRKRTQGEKTMYRDQVIVEAWKQSDNGHGFAAALKDKGYHLAQGRARLVIVDRYAQIHNPTRHLHNVRAKEFQLRLQDIDLAHLPDATKLSRDIQADNKRRYNQSLQHDDRVVRHENQMQDRHLEQRAQVSTHFNNRLTREREELSDHYRLDEQQTEIERIRQKTKNPHWWKRLLGITRKEQQHLHELEMNRQNAQWRLQEKIDRTTAERETALAHLKERQETEQRRSAEKLQAQKPAGYLDQAERDRMMDYFQEKRASRGRDGPSLER